MGFLDRFKRSERVHCLVMEHGGTYVHHEMFEKDNEIIWDKYYGNAYVVPPDIKPVKLKLGRKQVFAYLLWKDAGVAVDVDTLARNIPVKTNRDEAYAIMDSQSLRQVVQKNPAGYKLWSFFIIGLLIGTFILGQVFK
jgi:hypothetical protein